MMKIGIVRETRKQENRTPLSPKVIKYLSDKYDNLSFAVQTSTDRIFSDDEYRNYGIQIKEDLSDCDVLFGVKEPENNSLIPNKHYFFFGHMDEKPPYNRVLLQEIIDKKITFTDYEFITDGKNNRLIAFGYWAGIAGVYDTFRLYGLKYCAFELPKLDCSFTKNQILCNLYNVIDKIQELKIKILLIGNGKVSKGAKALLDTLGIKYVSAGAFKYMNNIETCYTIVGAEELTIDTYGYPYDKDTFIFNPERFASRFYPYAEVTDMLLCCHYYRYGSPVYLDERIVKSDRNKIRVIGDITCDIKGSIATTIRYSSHEYPFYDTDKNLQEVKLFENRDNISTMAVDTLPNALAREASEDFAKQVSQYIIPSLLQQDTKININDATQTYNGEITQKYRYLLNILNR
ncbi:MAG: hypothetical protein IJ180_00625 [Bacteroidales bacterium]|nr:hypothetical protein [Bacteroidales bacterium]